jgi:hypothetical protein
MLADEEQLLLELTTWEKELVVYAITNRDRKLLSLYRPECARNLKRVISNLDALPENWRLYICQRMLQS